ncbi:MAG TPA: BamA/TamA family outer membrane protein, partial [Gemmatimonadaceae bacterium]
AAGAATSIAASPLRAQGYFGKNQVQYQHFDWKVIETEHFLVHYYPDERAAAMDAARMAERAYSRLSRILGHEFSEKKPIMVFASRADFGQNNVTGDLGEGTGGVTEPMRDRMLLFLTGDYRGFEHVLTHEMVHEFQFDIFQSGRSAGSALSGLMRVQPPLWFMEGMAEYLSIGPNDPNTQTIIRDAALNGHLPTIEQMTRRPDMYFPYRYGQAFWEWVARRWGDEIVGEIMADVPTMGVEEAFKRETGVPIDDLGDEWREAMQNRHLPQIAQLDRPRRFSRALLTERHSGGQIFIAPALSPDGNYIAFLSNGSFLKGQVFIDLWLADARTGKRITRLVKSALDPNFEELQLLYSQSAFSPDGSRLAFTALGGGKEVLHILDVANRKQLSSITLPLDGITGPSWSNDGRQLVFSGNRGGITDLYVIDADGRNLRQLTNDRYGDLQPQWSPDGKSIAFATERGDGADVSLLRFPKMRIALYDLESGRIELLPGEGLNINPMWAPDSKSIAYVSDRTGIPNVFLYDVREREEYQLTNVAGGVTSLTAVSPAISWARGADKLAFTYFENGDYAVWEIDNPRRLARVPYRTNPVATSTLAAQAPSDSIDDGTAYLDGGAGADTAPKPPPTSSFYRTPVGFRPSGSQPGETEVGQPELSVAALLDSGDLALPDTTHFERYDYSMHLAPDYVARPTVGYARDNFGSGVFGGTAIVLSDMVGNHQLAFAGAVNGRIQEAQVFAGYTNLGHRLQYSTGLFQTPYYFGENPYYTEIPEGFEETQVITRYIVRQGFGVGIYSFDRFTRVEVAARLTNMDRTDLLYTRTIDGAGSQLTPYEREKVHSHSVNFIQPSIAYVSDNVLWGVTAPISGRRYRLQLQPAVGNYHWVSYLADYRRYDPILFNYLTIATRFTANVSTGRDADSTRQYLGWGDMLRGYDSRTFLSDQRSCPVASVSRAYRCSPLQGSSSLYAGAELRFPLIRGGSIGGVIPIPSIEGAFFYDAATAWFSGQSVSLSRRRIVDPSSARSLLTSHGFGIRVNLFNYVVLRWDYAIPHDAPSKKGFWQFTLYPPF